MADNHAASTRPTSRSHLTLCTVAGFATSLSAGLAAALGTLPDAWAAGGLMIAMPLVLGVVVTLGLASAWHILFRYGAHARALHERSIAFGIGVSLFLVGVGCSGWFTAYLIGARPALQSHRLVYVQQLRGVSGTVAGNVTADGSVVSAVKTAAGNLASTAEAEGKYGLTSGKAGQSVVYATLENAANSMAVKAAELDKAQDVRTQALTSVQQTIDDAARAASQQDGAGFEEAAAKAASELRAVADNRVGVSDLGVGMSIEHARAPITQAITDVSNVMRVVNARQKHVEIPFYQPIDGRMAVLVNPQPLPWIVAIVIEVLPLIFLGLLLTLWRDEEEPTAEIRPFGRRRPVLTAVH
jgi:hypothetical protein